MKRSAVRLIILFAAHEMIIFILGASAALRAERGGGIDGTALVPAAMVLLVVLGWMIRDMRGDNDRNH